ncbi:MAG TPA: SgcJ/EcaC family oxidoreductase [Acidimicrobiales bacterium]
MASDDDEGAVFNVLLQIGGAFRNLDATGIEDVYVEDADWTNAFGTTLKGNLEIAKYLRDLFADTHFGAGAPVAPPEASVRFIGDDVAVAKTYLERAGQQTSDGTTLPVRRNHSLKVLAKEAGRWRIVSDIYMDARDDTTL